MRILLAVLVSLWAATAMADKRLALPQNDRWRSECGSCHLAYPPQLLPAANWRRLMAQLDRHFGSDASLEPAAAAEIGDFLERHSATGKRARHAGESLRITETAWFVRKHRKALAKNDAASGARSAADCAACHTFR